MMRPHCEAVTEDLALLVAGDDDAVARHADHLAACDDCRDARHDAKRLAALLPAAGADHVSPPDLAERLLAALDAAAPPASEPAPAAATPARHTELDAPALAEPAASARRTELDAPALAEPEPAPTKRAAPAPQRPVADLAARRARARVWLAVGATAALAAGGTGLYVMKRGAGAPATGPTPGEVVAGGPIGKVNAIERAAADPNGGVIVQVGGGAPVALAPGAALPAGGELRTDDRTRAALELADGTQLVLDHRTTLAFDPAEPRRLRLTAGRVVANVIAVDNRPASIATPTGKVEVLGTRFAVAATDEVTTVQVVRGAVRLVTAGGAHEEVRAGEEGLIERGALSVAAAPGIQREVEWSELGSMHAQSAEEASSGLGALRAYKPGEQRDRDWNLALAKHDVKVRIVGPLARTEITETFRNDSDAVLEGVYQFPLPPDARIDSLELDVEDGFEQGAFIDKERAGKIWRGVIDKATPKIQRRPAVEEIIWVPGPWRDPALLDWKRGGRFELRVFPIPAKGARTIKLAYTQVVTPRGPWRQYVYPLPHARDGSTVADHFSVDVEVRGAQTGAVRAVGYPLAHDLTRADAHAMAFAQGGFVPRGDLVIDYRPTDGDAEVRAWSFAGGHAVAPDDKLAARKRVGIDPAVVEAQRAEAADVRPTAVLALRPKLPRWRESRPRDYTLVIDASQSMVGERFARATSLAAALVEQMDRRDRFTVMACDSECRELGDLRAPSARAAGEVGAWLATHPPAGASDVVAAVRAAAAGTRVDQARDRWVLYVGDGFATTGFRRVADVERALADLAAAKGHVGAIGIGADADAALLGAVARAGGGSYLAWRPGQSVGTAAAAALESTNGTALRGATVELPAGLADVAPSVLPTIRAGEEVLIAARITGDVRGEVVVRGEVGGQPFEQRYPLELAVSSAPGNAFVPRLWASLAIEQLERRGQGGDRAKIVALSQGYGVMSRETSLLVLESPAMFEAFGVDRGSPAARWTGDEAVEETLAAGTVAHGGDAADMLRGAKGAAAPAKSAPRVELGSGVALEKTDKASDPPPAPEPPATRSIDDTRARRPMPRPPGRGMVAMRRTWVRVPALAAYAGPASELRRTIASAETALAASPDSRERHRALVQALAFAGETERARDIAARWLERDKLDPQALGYTADLLGRDGDRELALRTLAGLVDLDADRPALHERMVGAYERAGRLAQACGHRIALATLGAQDAKLAGAAVRCLRGAGLERDAELILRAQPDDAARATVEKAATAAPPPARVAGELVLDATWTGGEDLDVAVIAPDGTRVSWMGAAGRTVTAADVTSRERERLGVRSLRRGTYLVEISRAGATAAPQRGTVAVTVLGTRRAFPFELTGARAVVGRIVVNLEERLVPVDGSLGGRPAVVASRVRIGAVADARIASTLRARTALLRACYERQAQHLLGLEGRVTLALVIDAQGGVRTATTTTSSPGFEPVSACVRAQGERLRFPALDNEVSVRIPIDFSSS